MADDLLDDGWWEIKDNEDEDTKPAKKSKTVEEDDDIAPEQDSLNKTGKAGKRKRKHNDKNENDKEASAAKTDKKSNKKRKKTQREIPKEDAVNNLTLWNFFKNEMKGRLSQIELEELKPIADGYLTSDSLPSSLDYLSTHLKQIIPKWQKDMGSLKENDQGCPVLLIISGSAKRSVDILRAIKGFKNPGCKTAKLFAKHFKLEDQEKFLKNSHIHIGVGTPNRILKLKSDECLRFKRLKYIIIDWSFKDAKQRKLVDIPDVKKDFVSLLQSGIFTRIKKGKLKYSLF